MKDVDKIETLKEEWVCKKGTDDQNLNGTEQSCEFFVDNLFEEAQKVGAICMPPTKVKNEKTSRVLPNLPGEGDVPEMTTKQTSMWKSTGYVGEFDMKTKSYRAGVMNLLFSRIMEKYTEEQADIVIKLWKNGFTVNDGELRSYTDVANRQFLDSIKKGELPFELRKTFDDDEVDVKVEDKKDEVYTLRKPVFHPFSGQGYRLGSATPRIISKANNDLESENKRPLPSVTLSDLEPVTKIQIWLADGERIVQTFNVSHRISHVRDFVTKYQGSQGNVPFSLTTSLPFLELLDETLTLEEANLRNAVIVQRLQKTTEPFRSFS